jgi:uncharacterized protein (UPF0335 family)
MARKTAQPGDNAAAAEELLSYIERVERLEVQKREIADDLSEVKREAKSRGYSVKAIERIVKERAETEAQRLVRQETEQLADIYRAALGMLGGTPLGEAARKRLSPPPEPDQPDDGGTRAEEEDHPASEITPADIEAARHAGKDAFQGGVKVIANPYIAGDPRRAAWDEGWCRAAGSDGMDIPEAWRRKKAEKAKKPDESEA